MKKLISILLVATMLFSMIVMAIPASAADAKTGLTFDSGFENVYASDKQVTAMPYTFETTLQLRASYGDNYWGDIFAWYSDEADQYVIIDVTKMSKGLGARIFCAERNDYFRKATSEVQVKFNGALEAYKGKTVHLAFVIDATANTVKLYINGTEWNTTVEYAGTGTTYAQSAEGFIKLYKTLSPAKLPMQTIGGDLRRNMGPNAQYEVWKVDNFRYLRGTMYNMCAFTDARSADEIKSDVSAMATTDANCLFAYDMSEYANGTLADKTGNGYTVKKGVDMGIAFSSGNENLYTTGKQFAEKPYTYEATITVPKSYKDQYWGQIFACYGGTSGNHEVWFDLHNESSKGVTPRFLVIKRGSTTDEVIARFYGALDAYKGQKVHLAVVVGATSTDLYINGVKWTGTVTYTKSGNGVNTGAGLYDLYNSLDLTAMPRLALGGDSRPANSAYAVTNVTNSRWFRGYIHNVIAFNDARTAAEIASDVNTLAYTDDSSIFAYDTSEKNDNDVIPDKTGNGYTQKKNSAKGMTFTSGFDKLYSASKKMTSLPSTYEATIYVPSSTADGDQYWGDILAWASYSKAGYDEIIWDVREDNNTKKVETRFLVELDSGESITVRFVEALEAYRGKQVHVALVIDSANSTVKLYVNGTEFTGTVSGDVAKTVELYNKVDVAKLPKFSVGGDWREAMPDSQWSVHHVDNWRYFRGGIYNLCAFDDVRTADEIAADKINMPTSGDGVMMSYDMLDVSNSNIVYDKSGNDYKLKSATKWLDAKDKDQITDYSYSFVVVGDTQVLTIDETKKDDTKLDGNMDKLYDWIIKNQKSKNIQFSFHMGDVTDNSTNDEWALAQKNFNKLNNKLPNNIARGNHDTANSMVSYYTTDMFKSSVIDGEEYGFFDGRGIAGYTENTLNTYQTITVNGVMYLMMALDLGPCDAVIEWANEVIAAHPYHNVIISTHSYLQGDYDNTTYEGADKYPYMDEPKDCAAAQYNPGHKYGPGGSYGVNWDFRLTSHKNAGDAYAYQDATYMLNNLVKKHSNISMVLCGHECSEYVKQISATGDAGNNVLQFLVDGQLVDRDLQKAGQGHAGLVAMFYFSEDGKKVTTEYYSTTRNQYLHDVANTNTYDVNTVSVPNSVKNFYNLIHSIDRADYSDSEWAALSARVETAKAIVTSTGSMTAVDREVAALSAMVKGESYTEDKHASVPANHVPGDFDGDGVTDADAKPVSTVAQFRAMANGGKYYLTNDLVITTGKDGVAAGSPVRGWTGNGIYFDGCGCTIEFDKNAGTAATATSLFDGSGATITIKNLNVTGVMNTPDTHNSHVSVLAQGGGNAYIENVVVDVDYTVNKTSVSAGIGGIWSKNEAGATSLTFKNVHFTGSMTIKCDLPSGDSGYIGLGGFVGRATGKGSAIFENCTNSGTITVNGKTNGKGIGGFIGANTNDGLANITFKNCEFTGSIITKDYTTTANVGGFIGYSPKDKLTITDSLSDGYISVNGTNTNVGGFVGYLHADSVLDMDDCVNKTDIIAVSNTNGSGATAAGFVGTMYKANIYIDDCTNYGDIEVKVPVPNAQNEYHKSIGGIVGNANWEYSTAYTMSFTNVTNEGDIKVVPTNEATNNSRIMSYNLGGILGTLDRTGGKLTFTNCTNKGDITQNLGAETVGEGSGWSAVGGIVGNVPSRLTSSNNPQLELTITNCTNEGNLTGPAEVGGIVGQLGRAWDGSVSGAKANLKVRITGCKNLGTIKVTHATGSWGTGAGIVALVYTTSSSTIDIKVSNCYNAGEILSSGNHAAGIFGSFMVAPVLTDASLFVIENCVNAGNVTLNRTPTSDVDSLVAAGILADNDRSAVTIKNCVNIGTISSGDANGLGTYPIANCTTMSKVSGAENVVKYYTVEGNVYLEGSVKRTDAAYTAFSTSASASDIESKINGFEYDADDKIALNGTAYRNELSNAIEAALAYKATLDETKYTLNSWKAFENAIADAQKLDLETEVNHNLAAAKNAIDAAKNELVLLNYAMLQDQIDRANALVENDYSEEDWAGITKTLDAAIKALTYRDQADIDAVAEELRNVIDRAHVIHRDILENNINDAENLNENDYSVADWNDILAAIEAAKAVLDSRDQNEINAAAEALRALVEGKATLDRTALEQAIADANALDETKYETSFWKALVELLTGAETTLNSSRDQAEIDAAAQALNEAISNTVAPDYTALNNAIANAQGLNENDYSEEAWAEILNAIQDVQYALNSRDQAVINSAADYLNAEVASKAKLDRTALEQAIADAKAFNENEFTVESWAAYNKYVMSAEMALTSRDQAEIDNAVKYLADAAALLERPDYTALLDAIANANGLNFNEYSIETEEAIKAAIANAEEYLNNRAQAYIDAAAYSLNNVVAEAVKLNYSALHDVINEANSYENDHGTYTDDSWAELVDALANAYATFSSSRDQATIDAAAAALRTAIDGLKEMIKDGWVEVDGGYAYYKNGEKLLAGVHLIGNYYYYFNENGINDGQTKYTGSFNDNGFYYVAIDGELVKGWQEVNGEWYYLNPDTYMAVSGNIKMNGVVYNFDKTGRLTAGVWMNIFTGYRYYYGPSYVQYGWYEIDGENYFFAGGVRKTGIAQVDSLDGVGVKWYDFGENGVAKEIATGVYYLDGAYRYLENGRAAEKYLVCVDGDYYFAQYGGKVVINKTIYAYATNCDLPAGTYTFGADGKMIGASANGEIVEIDGVLYYYEKGVGVEKSLFKYNGDYYFAKYKGEIIVGKVFYAWATACDLPAGNYEFGADGKMVQGIVEKNGKLYYYENGVGVEKGLFNYNGDYYFSKYGGEIVTGKTLYAWATVCDLPCGNYEFGADGKMVQGIVEKNGKLYYYENGNGVEKGLFFFDGYYYFSKYGGELITGKTLYAWATSCDLPCSHYEFGADGKMVQGIVEKDGKLYFYENGVGVEKGLFYFDGNYYFSKYGGEIITGKTFYAWATSCDLPAGNYEFGADGKMVQGIVEKNGKLYYYENGNGVEKGLFYFDGNYYFSKYGGELITGKTFYTWATSCDLPNGNYEFGADGKMVQGIVEKNGKLYYYENGVGVEKGLFNYNGDYYFAKYGGELVTDKTIYAWATSCDLPTGTYSFGTDGKMLNGIVEKDGGLYYYENGVATYKGVFYYEGHYYFAVSGGKLITNQKYYVFMGNGILLEQMYTFNELGQIVG